MIHPSVDEGRTPQQSVCTLDPDLSTKVGPRDRASTAGSKQSDLLLAVTGEANDEILSLRKIVATAHCSFFRVVDVQDTTSIVNAYSIFLTVLLVRDVL